MEASIRGHLRVAFPVVGVDGGSQLVNDRWWAATSAVVTKANRTTISGRCHDEYTHSGPTDAERNEKGKVRPLLQQVTERVPAMRNREAPTGARWGHIVTVFALVLFTARAGTNTNCSIERLTLRTFYPGPDPNQIGTRLGACLHLLVSNTCLPRYPYIRAGSLGRDEEYRSRNDSSLERPSRIPDTFRFAVSLRLAQQTGAKVTSSPSSFLSFHTNPPALVGQDAEALPYVPLAVPANDPVSSSIRTTVTYPVGILPRRQLK
ncbi:hypothetical protein RJ55_08265 [Drechmeria coniospora]|nr:hypothetical protein RJ55_08265 [Drechmeria coniospora]